MRKWMDKAAPDDPNAWWYISGLWPTQRGTYETADLSLGTSKAATGAARVDYAFAGKTLTGKREYVVDASHIWEYSSGSLTDRTNGVDIGGIGAPMMVQYGNVTICVMGVGKNTSYSTGTTFSHLAGAPKGEIVVVQSNCVLIFNTDTATDGWAASDTGDYTNWTTGTAESGRIIATPGPIRGAVAYGNDVFVFKESAIYRMTYTLSGWQVKLVWNGIGLSSGNYDTYVLKYQVVACQSGIAFCGGVNEVAGSSNPPISVHLFDGVSRPVQLNPLTTIYGAFHPFLYNPIDDVLTIASSRGATLNGGASLSGITYVNYYYSFPSDMWGRGGGCSTEDFEATTTFPQFVENGVLQGDYYARAETSYKPVYWRFRNITTGAFYRNAPQAPSAGFSSGLSVQAISTGIGDPHKKTSFRRVTPILRKRTDVGSDIAGLVIYIHTERHKVNIATAVYSSSVTESTQRNRFDFLASGNYLVVSLTFSESDIEIDDFTIDSIPAGTD